MCVYVFAVGVYNLLELFLVFVGWRFFPTRLLISLPLCMTYASNTHATLLGACVCVRVCESVRGSVSVVA